MRTCGAKIENERPEIQSHTQTWSASARTRPWDELPGPPGPGPGAVLGSSPGVNDDQNTCTSRPRPRHSPARARLSFHRCVVV